MARARALSLDTGRVDELLAALFVMLVVLQTPAEQDGLGLRALLAIYAHRYSRWAAAMNSVTKSIALSQWGRVFIVLLSQCGYLMGVLLQATADPHDMAVLVRFVERVGVGDEDAGLPTLIRDRPADAFDR